MSGGRAAQNTQPSRPHIERASVNEIMPPEITGQILALCDDLGAMAPLYLNVSPAPEARMGWCSTNVLDRCREKGGEPRYGWLLWEASGLYLNAEFHCVWRDGQDLHDITPTQEGKHACCSRPIRGMPRISISRGGPTTAASVHTDGPNGNRSSGRSLARRAARRSNTEGGGRRRRALRFAR